MSRGISRPWVMFFGVSQISFSSMPCRGLRSVTDLRPLQGMELKEIWLTPKNITQGLEIPRDMKSLERVGLNSIQVWPAAEFWERYDQGEFKDVAWRTI